MLRKLFIISLFACSITFYTQHATRNITQIESQNQESVFMAINTVDMASGTAFKVEYNDVQFYLTNAHVCDTAPLLVLKNPKHKVVVSVVRLDFNLDLCMMQLAYPETDDEIPAIKIAKNELTDILIYTIGYGAREYMAQDGVIFYTKNMDVSFDYYLVSYSDYLELATRIGSVEKLESELKLYCEARGTAFKLEVKINKKKKEVEVMCLGNMSLTRTNFKTYGGASGSPVFNGNGELIGVINSGQDFFPQGTNEVLNFIKLPFSDLGNFIPLSSVIKFIETQTD